MATPVNLAYAYECMIKYTSVSNKDIKIIFEVSSSRSVWLIRRAVLDYMAEQGIPHYHGKRLSIEIAYPLWGLDEKDLEHRYAKAKKYKLIKDGGFQ